MIALSAAYAGDQSSDVQAVFALAGAVIPSALGDITPGMPPALMLHGDADPLVPYAWALELKNTLTAKGVRVDWHVYPGQDHIVANYHREAEALIPPFLVSVLQLGTGLTRSPLPAVSDRPAASPSRLYNPADLNHDGRVDRTDYEIFRSQFTTNNLSIFDYNTFVSQYVQ